MKIVIFFEDVCVRQKVNFSSTLVSFARHLHWRHFDATNHFHNTVLNKALGELHRVHLAIAPDRQAQHLAQRIYAAHTHPVQATGHFVAILIEFATCMQFSQRNLSSRTFRLMLVVHLHSGGDPTTVVNHANRVVGVNSDHDVITMASQGFVDGIVNHLKHQMVKTSAVRSVANVHAWTLAHCFKSFQNLDRTFAISFRSASLIGINPGLKIGTSLTSAANAIVVSVGYIDLISISWFILFCHGPIFFCL